MTSRFFDWVASTVVYVGLTLIVAMVMSGIGILAFSGIYVMTRIALAWWRLIT